MPGIRRKVTQASDIASKILVSMEKEHQLKQHTFDYKKMERSEDALSFEIHWQCKDGGCAADVVVLNKLPHLIPTGDFGFRKGILLLQAKTSSGETLTEQTVELYKETKTALLPLQERTFQFSLPAETGQVELTLLRESADETNRFIIASKAFVRPETNK